MKKLLVLMVTAVTVFSPVVAHADLVGTSVNGDFELNGVPATNLFDPGNGLVPAGFGNSSGLPVTIGAEIEFGVSDGIILYSFDFSGTGLSITNVSNGTETGFVATFTDSGFSGLNLATVTALTGFSLGLSGSKLTVTFVGDTPEGTHSGAYSLTAPSPGPVPEPGTLALIGTGVLGAAGAIRRRLL